MHAEAEALSDPAARLEAIAATAPFYQEALERDKNDPELLAGWAMALIAANKPEEALPLFRQALRLNPFDRESALWMAHIYENKAASEESREPLRRAIDYYQRAERLAPLAPEQEIRFAMTLAALGDIEQAYPRLFRATGGEEDSPWMPMLQQFDAMLRQIQSVDQAAATQLAQNTTAAEGIAGLAEAALLRGQTQRAFYLLELALRRAPGHDPAWILMGAACAQMEGADHFLEKWGRQRRRDKTVWDELARRCARSGAWEASLRYLDYAVGGGERPEQAEIRLAEIALEMKQTQRAQWWLQQAVEKRPEDPAPWLRMADLAIEAQDKTRAGQFLAEAEKRHAFPEDIEARSKKAGLDSGVPFSPVRTIIR
jgi:Tfp pilus assembly protein PilF